MNTTYHPIPAEMPLNAAANLMLRRGEARNFYKARAIIAARRARARYGSTTINPSDPSRAAVESPRMWLPYRDD